jgi:hypothetical protein
LPQSEYLVLIPSASLEGLLEGQVKHHTTTTVYLVHLWDIASSGQEEDTWGTVRYGSMHRAIVRQSGYLPDSLFVVFTEIRRDRWIGELDDDLDTEVNTKTEEHDHSSDDEDEEDMIFADDGEELDDDGLAEEGY